MSKSRLKEADKLIQSARIYAVSTYFPLCDEFPEIKAVAESELLEFWDYLITIAGVGTAFMEIADTVPIIRQIGLTHAIKKQLEDWQEGSYFAMADFIQYAHNLISSDVEIPDAIGGWIWVNLEKHDQANENLVELASSLRLVRVVGLPLLMTFHNWWLKK